VTPELLAKDPDNRLIARGPRYRVDAEAVRDIALAASGLLTDKIGGPSVYPPAPALLFQPPASYSPKTGTWSKGPTGTAARSTPSASAPCPIPCCKRSTLLTERWLACGAQPVEHSAASAHHAE
jgi:hypothetical protein